MTDYAAHQPRTAKRARHSASAGLAFALATLVALIVAGAGIVALLLWPRTVPDAPDAPALPITVGGVLFNVPPAAIRVPLQRRPGAQERVDLAFLWPSLQPPDPAARPAPSEQAPPIDRIFITIEPQSTAVAPNDRVRSIYPRYLAETQFDGPDGLKVIAFKEGTPYQGEDLIYDGQQPDNFLVRCTRNGAGPTPGMCLYTHRIEAADLVVRFPRDWLDDWRAIKGNIERLIADLRPRRR